MARIKNVTDEPLSVPSLDLIVPPGEIAEVPDADGFKDNPAWQVTTTRKSDKTEEQA